MGSCPANQRERGLCKHLQEAGGYEHHLGNTGQPWGCAIHPQGSGAPRGSQALDTETWSSWLPPEPCTVTCSYHRILCCPELGREPRGECG